jgi:hypothetical protein
MERERHMITVIAALRQYHTGAITFEALLADFGQRPWPLPRKQSWDETEQAAPACNNDASQIDIANSLGWITDRQRTRLVEPVVCWRAAH